MRAKRRRGEVGLESRSGTSDPLEELDLVARPEGDDGFAPGRRAAQDASSSAPAALLGLGLGGQHVDVQHRDLEELLDGGRDLVLVRAALDGEGVLVAALREIERLLADHRPDDDLGGEGGHAGPSSRGGRAAGHPPAPGPWRAESSRDSSREGATTRTWPPATPSAPRCSIRTLVLISSIARSSTTLTAPSPNLPVSAPRRASRFICLGRRWAYERGCGPKTLPRSTKPR